MSKSNNSNFKRKYEQSYSGENANTSKKMNIVNQNSTSQIKINVSPSLKSNPNNYLGKGSHKKDIIDALESTPTKSNSSSPKTPKKTPPRLSKYSPFKSPAKSPRKLFIPTNIDRNEVDTYIDFYDRVFEKVTLVAVVQMKEWYDMKLIKDHLIDMDVLERFCGLTKSARNIYVRLINRKHVWIKVDSLDKYSKVSTDIKIELEIMKKAGVLEYNYENEDLLILLNLLHSYELKNISKDFKLSVASNLKKEDLVQGLYNFAMNQKTLFGGNSEKAVKSRIKAQLGDCIKLNKEARDTFLSCVVLVTLPLHFDFIEDISRLNDYVSRIVRTVKGEIKFPQYELSRTCVFKSRRCFDEYLAALKLCSEIEVEAQSKNTKVVLHLLKNIFELLKATLNDEEMMAEIIARPIYLRRYCAGACYVKILTSKISELKRDAPELAIEILNMLLHQNVFSEHKKPVWFELLAQIYQVRFKDNNKAADTLIEAFECLQRKEEQMNTHLESIRKLQSWSWIKYPLVERATTLIGRKTGKIDVNKSKILQDWLDGIDGKLTPPEALVLSGKVMPSSGPGLKQVCIQTIQNGDTTEKVYSGVEERVQEHFRSQGFLHGRHDEGRTLRCILYALLWDNIYCIPDHSEKYGIFHSPYQEAPLDWNTLNFIERRKDLISKRLDELKEMTPKQVLSEVMLVVEKHEGESSVISQNSWNLLSRDNVQLLTSLITCLGVELFIKIGEHIISDVANNSKGFPDLTMWNQNTKQCIFVEVKSLNDRLSVPQKVWLHKLKSWGAKCYIAHMKPTDGR